MVYKDYGKTGKKVSAIGFGGMRFVKDGDSYDYDKCAEVVRTANRLGVNYFDTAPFYNEDQSELIFGHALKEMPGEYYISSKSGDKDGSELRKRLETSLTRLGVEKINFYHIWCILDIEDYKSRMVKGGAYEAALKAKEEGLIEHIVFSTHCNGDEIETIVNNGGFEGMTIGYNILNAQFRGKGLRAAYEKGLGVATMNPLGGGIIPEKADFFDFLRGEKDKTVVDAALRFNCSHKEISTVLAGMGTIEQVIQNTEIGRVISPFDENKLKEINDRMSSSMDKLCTGCRYCEYCPQEIPVSKHMLSYNYSILGNSEATMNEFKWHWGIDPKEAEKCIECGICESKCTQHLPIIGRLKDIAAWTEQK
ncbi:MAG: aldo/keto reductase [Clostridiales bacterium 43-6]|nr:MAG: aldo/keto reductase [Clostridiales bacterium 43-6]